MHCSDVNPGVNKTLTPSSSLFWRTPEWSVAVLSSDEINFSSSYS